MHTGYPANSAESTLEPGGDLMPHRIVILIEILHQHHGWIAAGFSGASGLAGAGLVWAMNAEGWQVAIGAIGTGIAGFLVIVAPAFARTAPDIARAIQVVGMALVEVVGKMRKMINETAAKVDETHAAVTSSQSAIVNIRKDADEARARAERAEAEARRLVDEAKAAADARVAEAEAKHAAELKALHDEMEAMNEESTIKRHDLRDSLQPVIFDHAADLLETRSELERAKAKIAQLEEVASKIAMGEQPKVDAINLTAKNVETVASRMDPPIPVETPHLEAIQDVSDPVNHAPKGTP
jgi:hypothetical protein